MNRPSGPYALLFPGQLGALEGMERPFLQEPAFADALEQLEAWGERDYAGLVSGPGASSLEDRFGASLLMVTHGWACSLAVMDRLGPPALSAGYSLGFYAAAAAAGCAPLPLFLEWVRRVNACNQKRFPAGRFSMGACTGLEPGALVERLSTLGLPGLEPADINNRMQVVFAGPSREVAQAVEMLKGEVLDIRDLGFDVPLHSPYMAATRDEVAPWWNGRDLADPDFPLVSPIDGALLCKGREIRETVREALALPTDWTAVTAALKARGAAWAVDLSPGGEISRMTRWNWRGLSVLPARDIS